MDPIQALADGIRYGYVSLIYSRRCDALKMRAPRSAAIRRLIKVRSAATLQTASGAELILDQGQLIGGIALTLYDYMLMFDDEVRRQSLTPFASVS